MVELKAGTHDELVKEKKSYFSIYSKQTQEKKLINIW